MIDRYVNDKYWVGRGECGVMSYGGGKSRSDARRTISLTSSIG